MWGLELMCYLYFWISCLRRASQFVGFFFFFFCTYRAVSLGCLEFFSSIFLECFLYIAFPYNILSLFEDFTHIWVSPHQDFMVHAEHLFKCSSFFIGKASQEQRLCLIHFYIHQAQCQAHAKCSLNANWTKRGVKKKITRSVKGASPGVLHERKKEI